MVCVRLLHLRPPNLLEFGLSRSTLTVQLPLEGTGSVFDRSCFTSSGAGSLQIHAHLCIFRRNACSVRAREPRAPRGTTVGCKSTDVPGVAVVYRPLYILRS